MIGETRWQAETVRLKGALMGRAGAAIGDIEATYQRALEIARTRGTVVGAKGSDESRPALARPRQGKRSARTPWPPLRLVHRGLRYAGLEGRKGAT